MAELGTKMRIAGFGCEGVIDPKLLPEILARIVELASMSTGGMPPKIWAYPLPDGRGGTGETAIQPLVESFLAIDTWPKLGGLPKVYVVLASCEHFELDLVKAYLEEIVGPVLRQGYFEI